MQVIDTRLLSGSWQFTFPFTQLTYSMEQSPSWEADWFCSQSRNSPYFWNPKVPHRTHKCPTPVPILSQKQPTITSRIQGSIRIQALNTVAQIDSEHTPPPDTKKTWNVQ